jgi:hypothetical protein
MSRLTAGLLLLCLVLPGCAQQLPFTSPPAVATRQLSTDELLRDRWPGDARVWHIRQTALFEIHGRKLPLAGMLRLDGGRREARLVGLNDLGVKLFDIAVTPTGHEEHYLFPELAGISGVGAAIAGAVRHVFLAPQPAATDTLQIGKTEYRLQRREDDREMLFVFGGPGADLLEKRVRGGNEDWRARYFDYRPAAEGAVPGGILLEDARGGYRLTLWLEEARVLDE